MKKACASDMIANNQYRTVYSTSFVEDTNMLITEFNARLKRILSDHNLSEPDNAGETHRILSIRGAIRVETIKLIDKQCGIDMDAKETIDDYMSRKLVDKVTTLQGIVEAAIKCGNKTAQHLQDNVTTSEELEELLGVSPDAELSLRALLRSRGPQRELDLNISIVKLGGNLRIATRFPSDKSFSFIGCSVLEKTEGVLYKLSYSSIESDNELPEYLKEKAGKVDIIVPPDTMEEQLMDFAKSCKTEVDLVVCPIRNISSDVFTLLLTRILNPEEITAAANRTLEEIIREVERRSELNR